jgi:hypothetical protein
MEEIVGRIGAALCEREENAASDRRGPAAFAGMGDFG